MSQKIRIKLKSYDHSLVDKSAERIVKTVKTTGAVVSGPIPLPTHKRIFTVNRSTFVNKKSREQFQLSAFKRLIDIYSPNNKTIDAYWKLEGTYDTLSGKLICGKDSYVVSGQDELNLLEDVAKIFVDFPLVPCTACNYCMPCPYGLDIPGVFAHYNKCINEGYVSEDEAGTKEYRKARRAFLVSLDRNVEKLRQANHCIGCRKCMEACPQKIDIPHTMRRIDSYTEKIRRNG